MPAPANTNLLAKAWASLQAKGPVGLGRDVRDYLRWRLASGAVAAAVDEPAPLSNLELNQRELQSLPDVLESRPILVYAEATTRCNLHCFMCRLSFPETTRQARQHMDLEVFARLEPLLEPGGRLSLFGLGEPLLNPNFVEMLRIAKQRKVFVGLNSNAMLLTERIARAMVELEQDLLVISFSGGTKETYERVITGASYERVLANLRRLNEIKTEKAPGGTPQEQVKPVLQFQFTAMRDNIRELPQAVRLAIDLRCSGLVCMPLTVVDRSLADQSLLQPELWTEVERAFQDARDVATGARYPFDLQLPIAELLKARRGAEKRGREKLPLPLREPGQEKLPLPLGEARTGQSVDMPQGMSMGSRGEGLSGDQNQNPTPNTQHPTPNTQHPTPNTQHPTPNTQHPTPDTPSSICYEPWQTFYVRDDGTVNTCCYSNRILGDLKEQTALDIWNGGPYRRFRARTRSSNKPAECRVCHKLQGNDLYDQRVDDVAFYDEL